MLEHAKRTGNVAATCRVFGISRTAFYRWQERAERYGVEALMPKGRRRPQLADELGRRGYAISKTTVQKHLVDHGLGKRAQRLARAACLGSSWCSPS